MVEFPYDIISQENCSCHYFSDVAKGYKKIDLIAPLPLPHLQVEKQNAMVNGNRAFICLSTYGGLGEGEDVNKMDFGVLEDHYGHF